MAARQTNEVLSVSNTSSSCNSIDFRRLYSVQLLKFIALDTAIAKTACFSTPCRAVTSQDGTTASRHGNLPLCCHHHEQVVVSAVVCSDGVVVVYFITAECWLFLLVLPPLSLVY